MWRFKGLRSTGVKHRRTGRATRHKALWVNIDGRGNEDRKTNCHDAPLCTQATVVQYREVLSSERTVEDKFRIDTVRGTVAGL